MPKISMKLFACNFRSPFVTLKSRLRHVSAHVYKKLVKDNSCEESRLLANRKEEEEIEISRARNLILLVLLIYSSVSRSRIIPDEIEGEFQIFCF